MTGIIKLNNIDVILLCGLLLLVVLLSMNYWLTINDLKKEINKKDKIMIKAPIEVTWNKELDKAILSIELDTKNILTLLLNKTELSTLTHDLNNLNDFLDGKMEADSLDAVKGKKGKLKKLKDTDTITISAKLYKELTQGYNALKKENTVLKKGTKK